MGSITTFGIEEFPRRDVSPCSSSTKSSAADKIEDN